VREEKREKETSCLFEKDRVKTLIFSFMRHQKKMMEILNEECHLALVVVIQSG
jgi:hypothetical protein